MRLPCFAIRVPHSCSALVGCLAMTDFQTPVDPTKMSIIWNYSPNLSFPRLFLGSAPRLAGYCGTLRAASSSFNKRISYFRIQCPVFCISFIEDAGNLLDINVSSLFIFYFSTGLEISLHDDRLT